LFEPKSSAASSPALANRAAARSLGAEEATSRPAPGGHGLVWVNTESHVYHREGSPFYGTTKKGKYVTEAEAIREGNRVAGNLIPPHPQPTPRGLPPAHPGPPTEGH
jgi:hypothetical protein